MAIVGTDSRSIGQQQRQFQRKELHRAVRALLMTPLMNPDHDDFPSVRRQTDALRDFFGRETGWTLRIEHEGARLHKLPADLASTTRGLPFHDRRRYVLPCLLERADPQITLRLLGERLLQFAAKPTLAASRSARRTSGENWWRCAVPRSNWAWWPSMFRPEDAPPTLDHRLHALVDEHVADSDEGRRINMVRTVVRNGWRLGGLR